MRAMTTTVTAAHARTRVTEQKCAWNARAVFLLLLASMRTCAAFQPAVPLPNARDASALLRSRPPSRLAVQRTVTALRAAAEAAGAAGTTEVAVLGGGCFWCTEAIFLQAPGVLSVTPGYAGGRTVNPTYQQVTSGKTGHAEVIRVEFDPEVISRAQVYDLHLATHDATQINRQGPDVGTQYRSTIMVASAEEQAAALLAIQSAQANLQRNKLFGLFGGNGKIATVVEQDAVFYPAEQYHRDFFDKNPNDPYSMRVIAPKLQSWKVRSTLKAMRDGAEAP